LKLGARFAADKLNHKIKRAGRALAVGVVAMIAALAATVNKLRCESRGERVLLFDQLEPLGPP
jgi:hypothetical protein